MLLKRWEHLPQDMQNEAVRPYYERLKKRTASLLLKRVFDFVVSLLLIVMLSPVFLMLAILIVMDSPGSVFFTQVRITQFGKPFKILKFRTMVQNAEKIGTQVTLQNDTRITRVGKLLRHCRLDELPQLFNILLGDMSFVGTRPEVPKYVAAYTEEMRATLLLPAGVTSLASIVFKDEEKYLSESGNADKTYIDTVLPQKMKYNLYNTIQFRLWLDIKIMINTVLAVCGMKHKTKKFTDDVMKDKFNFSIKDFR